MHKARTKKQELRRRILTFTIVPAIIIVVVTLLVLYIIGYRFNANDRSLDQGGLMQFASRPSGANIEVDGTKLRRKTNTRLDASSGTHTVTMSKAGYRPWQKTVAVEPGKLLWLDYIRLIPETVENSQVLTLNSIDQAVSVYEKNMMLVMQNKSRPVITIVDLSSDKPTQKQIALPSELSEKTSSSTYTIDSVDGLGRYVILKSAGDATNWFFVDLTDPTRSLNLSTVAGAPVSDVQFFGNDARKVYIVSKNTVRMIEIDERTTSAPLITNVDSITASPKGVLAYVTKRDDTSSQRIVGYFTAGAAKPRVIRRIFDGGKQPIDFRIDTYQDDRYGAVRIGNNLEIIGLQSESSDAADEPRTESISTITLPEGSDYLSFSPGGRFVLAQKSSTFTTYDLELKKVTTASLKGDTSVNRQLRWLDEHHIWSDRGGKLTLYEFDGANPQIIGKAAPSNAPLLSRDGTQLWYLNSSNRKMTVLSAQLIK